MFHTLEKRRASKSRFSFRASLEQKTQRWNSKFPLRRAAILATGGKVHAHLTCMTQGKMPNLDAIECVGNNQMIKTNND